MNKWVQKRFHIIIIRTEKKEYKKNNRGALVHDELQNQKRFNSILVTTRIEIYITTSNSEANDSGNIPISIALLLDAVSIS